MVGGLESLHPPILRINVLGEECLTREHLTTRVGRFKSRCLTTLLSNDISNDTVHRDNSQVTHLLSFPSYWLNTIPHQYHNLPSPSPEASPTWLPPFNRDTGTSRMSRPSPRSLLSADCDFSSRS